MALNELNSSSVRFTKEKASENDSFKKPNFFDDDFGDFEMFDNDQDFRKMTAKNKNEELNDSEEAVGKPWGGDAYSIQKESKTNAPSKLSVPQMSSSRQSYNQKPQQSTVETFHPFQMRDNLSASKFTETSQVIQTSELKTERSSSIARTTTSTRYEANTNSIENVVQNSKIEMSDAERIRMKAEIKELQKTVSSLRQQHKKTPEPCETVRKLMLNQPCVLELYKSLEGKISLLNEAIKLGDGDALLTVILFLKKTVKPTIFLREIKKQPVAANHIISFMKAHYDYDELIKLLRFLNRNEEAMILEYKKAVKASHVDSQIQAINTCQRIYETNSGLADMVSILNDHQNLLKRQVNIEIKDKRSQAEGKDQLMRLHPRKVITSTPLIETLHYCCFYHYGKNDAAVGPLSLQKDFKLTDKQVEWTMIGARAELKKWGDLDAIFTSKGWLGSNKQKSYLGFDKVVGVLEKANAPPDILSKYLALVEDLENRLALATKLKCHKVAVETIVSMKDKQKLEEYRKHLERTHPVQALISSYLQNSQIKWR